MAWLSRLVSDVESRAEFTRSQNDLYEFLNNKKTVEDLGQQCVDAAVELLRAMRNKEHHLANYVRLYVTNCMDAHTTSPVEGQNRKMKNTSKVNSNMNLDNSLANAQKGATNSIKKRDNEAMRDMNKTMQSSRAKTRRDIIRKSQHLADQNFDARLEFKGNYYSLYM